MSDIHTEVPAENVFSSPRHDNVVQVMGRVNRRKSVSLLAGWSWLRYCEGEPESFPVEAVLGEDCPMVSYNTLMGHSMQSLENPNQMGTWLPMVLHSFVRKVLLDVHGHSDAHQEVAAGPGWDAFRMEIERLTGSTFDHLVNSVEVRGIEVMTSYIVECMYYESGLGKAILEKASGRPLLRKA